MATALERQPGGSQKYVDFDEFIDFQVNKTRAGIRHTDLLTALVTVALVVSAYLLSFVVLDQWVVPGGFGYWPRLIMLTALGVYVVGWVGYRVVYPYLRRVTSLYAAKQIEYSQPELKSSLLTLVDLKRAGRRVPPHIVAAMEKRAALRLSQMDVEQAVDRRPLMRLAYGLFGVVVLICLYTVFSPKPISASILRALIPVSDAPVATRTRIIKVDPGNASVLARSQLDVTVELAGEIPAEVTLLLTTHDHSLVDDPVALRDTGEKLNRFRGTLAGPNGRGLLQDFTYVIQAGDAFSDRYTVTVEQAPYATVEEVVYEYPRYMGLNPRTQPGGEIDAWEATKVTIHAVTNMPVAKATIMRHETEDTSLRGSETRMTVTDGTHLTATLDPLKFADDGTYEHFYRILVETEDGKSDPVPRLYTLKIRRDLPPEIKLLHPASDVELPANGVLPFAYEASDPDFMLSDVRLQFEYQGQPLDAKTRTLYQAPPDRARVQGGNTIDLSEFAVQPGDVLTFWLAARDNKEPHNVTVTPKLNIAITAPATNEEVQQRLEEEQQAAQQRLDEAQQEQQSTGENDPDAGDEDPTNAGEEPDAGADEPMDDAQPPAADQTQSDPRNQTPERPQDSQQSDQTGEQGDGNASEQQGSGEGDPQPGSQGTTQSGREGDSPQDGMNDSAEPGNQGSDSQPSNQQRNGSQPGTRQNRSQQPGDRASDDEALQRLLDQYKPDVDRDREQQQSGEGSDNASAENHQAGEQNGTQSNQSDSQDTGDNSAENQESGTHPNQGETPRDDGSQQSPRNDRSQTGPQRSPGEQRPGDRSTPGSPSQSENPGDDPTADENGPGQDPSRPRPDGEQPTSNGNSQSGRPADPSQSPMNEGEGTSPGENRPADDANPDQARPGTGNDPGTPMEGDNPDAPADRTTMPQEGHPSDSNDPATQSGERPANPNQQGTPRETGGSQNPNGARPPRNANPNNSSEPGDRGSSNADRPSDRPPARTGDQPNGPDTSDPGEGNQNGQRSEQPAGGEQGSSQQASEGTPNSTQQGPGDSTSSPGSQSQSGGESGMPGEGSQSQPGGNQPGSEGSPSSQGSENGDMPGSEGSQSGSGDMPSSPMPGSGEQGSGEQGSGEQGSSQQGSSEPNSNQQGSGEQGSGEQGSGQQGSGQQGGNQQGSGQQGSGQQGSNQSGTPGQGSPTSGSSTGSGGAGDGNQAPSGAGNGPTGSLDPEQAELQDKRRATELVLKRLQDELQRGEVSDELLQDLGWTEDNLRDFMSRLQQRLADSGEDKSPAAEARRRQFQEILRGLDYSAESQQRDGGEGDRPVEQGYAAPRRPAPSEFRSDEEAFKKRLSRETAPQ